MYKIWAEFKFGDNVNVYPFCHRSKKRKKSNISLRRLSIALLSFSIVVFNLILPYMPLRVIYKHKIINKNKAFH
jgi:hypothetical protein